MAKVDDLKKEISDLQKKLAGLEPYSTGKFVSGYGKTTHITNTGGAIVVDDPSKPIYQNSYIPNEEYNKTLESLVNKQSEYQDELFNREGSYNTLAQQIQSLAGPGQPTQYQVPPQALGQDLAALGASRNYGASDLSTRLNYQVSDEQILNDYNTTKLSKLNDIISRGNTQIAGITERLNSAQALLDQLPSGDPRRESSAVYVKQLQSDLSSVQSAVADASKQVQDFKPIEAGSTEANNQISSFRDYLRLPEEKAAEQIRQISPETFRTAQGLGRAYQAMATRPLGPTTTAQTEEMRNALEQEAINQLRLGSTLGAEERRGYEQAIRAAQTARGNIFGLGPAVQEAAQIGAAGEQRKLARYGAAQAFLGSGETTGAALARDLALRDTLQQARLGAAAGFIAGGPKTCLLGQARTAQQQAAFQNYIQANQALPGQFGQAPSTAQNFYQTAQPEIPVALTAEFNKLYGSQADYGARTYGAYTAAKASQPTFAQQFGAIASGISGFIPSFSFSR